MRLSSLLEFPALPLDDRWRDAEKVDAADPKLYATQNHFKSVFALLDDLNEKRKEFLNPGHAAGWWVLEQLEVRTMLTGGFTEPPISDAQMNFLLEAGRALSINNDVPDDFGSVTLSELNRYETAEAANVPVVASDCTEPVARST